MDRQVAQDRGYAWVVLVASMGCNYLTGVLLYFVGVIHVELLDKFQGDVTTTAWAGSLYSSLEMLGAPLASTLVYAHSCRLSVVVGGVLLCVGFVTSAFVTSVLQLVFTYGVIAGTGLALSYSPSLMIISFYFHKFHGLASGLSGSGFAVGILTGSLMTQTFIDMYSLRGAFFLIAGLGIQCCVFGMLYRPTQHEGKRRSHQGHSPEQGITWKASGERSEAPSLLTDSSKDPYNQEIYVFGERRDPALTVGENGLSVVEKTEENGLDSTQTFLMSSERTQNHTVPSCRTECGHISDGEERNGSPLLNPEEKNPDGDISACLKPIEDDPRRSASLNRCLKMFRGVSSLMKNWAFLVHCCGIFFAAVNVSGVYLHLPEYARTQGTQSTQAAALFVGVGIFNLVSRVGSGLMLTTMRLNGLDLSVGLMTLCGLSSCLFPLYSSTYVGQMTFASVFGLVHGGFSTLINVLTVELADFRVLPAAYGTLIFAMGLGYVTGPPLSGLIVDRGGTYGHSFIFLGMAMFASAGCDLMAKIIHKRQLRHSQHSQDTPQWTTKERGAV